MRVVERLHAESVARDDGSALIAVPGREPELAPELSRELLAVSAVQVGDDLRVTARSKRVAGSRERVAELCVVVELAVLNPPERPGVVAHRLMTPVEVDDAQASCPERDPRCAMDAAVVGAAVGHRVGHAIEHVRGDYLARFTAAHLNDPADSAHSAQGSGA